MVLLQAPLFPSFSFLSILDHWRWRLGNAPHSALALVALSHELPDGPAQGPNTPPRTLLPPVNIGEVSVRAVASYFPTSAAACLPIPVVHVSSTGFRTGSFSPALSSLRMQWHKTSADPTSDSPLPASESPSDRYPLEFIFPINMLPPEEDEEERLAEKRPWGPGPRPHHDAHDSPVPDLEQVSKRTRRSLQLGAVIAPSDSCTCSVCCSGSNTGPGEELSTLVCVIQI